MNLLLFEPKLCSLYELQTIYSLKDFYDMLEIVDVRRELQEEHRRELQEEHRKEQERINASKNNAR